MPSAGINGYILKASPVEEIIQAIRSIMAVYVYVTPALARFGPFQRGAQNDAETIQLPAPAAG